MGNQRAYSALFRCRNNAEYEREDYQARALLGMRILANSVSGQAAEPAATVAGRIGGHDMTHPWAAASGQGGCVLAVIFPRTVGVAGSET